MHVDTPTMINAREDLGVFGDGRHQLLQHSSYDFCILRSLGGSKQVFLVELVVILQETF